MQCVPLEAKTSAGQAPEEPVQVSATSHWPAEARQVTVLAWKTSTQVLLVPVQWSALSVSQAPPCDAPVQLVALEAKPSAGQVPDVPVQSSATSHWPADARQTNVLALKASTQVLLVPVQRSAVSSSQAPPCDAPVQLVVLEAKPSAGQAPAVPVHVSAT